MVSAICPPAFVKAAVKTAAASAPGAQSDWTITTFLLPFFAAHEIGRALGDDRRAGDHDNGRNLALRHDRRHGERGWRDAGADHADLVVDDKLLRETLGVIRHAGVVLDDQLDLLAGNRRPVLRHIELGGRGDLLTYRGEHAGQRHNDADLDGILGNRRIRRRYAECGHDCGEKKAALHRFPPWNRSWLSQCDPNQHQLPNVILCPCLAK
jgi:hypothetical protein